MQCNNDGGGSNYYIYEMYDILFAMNKFSVILIPSHWDLSLGSTALFFCNITNFEQMSRCD